VGEGTPAVIDWEPLIRGVLADRARSVPARVISARFHEALGALAEELAVRSGLARVVLAGGCFQNARLTRLVHRRLAGRGLQVFTPRLYPPNDGGLSLGQALVAALRWKERTHVSGHPR
jgi:hydrogenase maturation protein HypF